MILKTALKAFVLSFPLTFSFIYIFAILPIQFGHFTFQVVGLNNNYIYVGILSTISLFIYFSYWLNSNSKTN